VEKKMEFITRITKSSTLEQSAVGNKAARLAFLSRSGFNVPEFFVINPSAAIASEPEKDKPAVIDCEAGARAEIETTVRGFCADGSLVAVRSSSIEEDDAQNSFAGQLDSFLNIRSSEVCAKVIDVWQSAFSERIQSYRKSRDVSESIPVPGVFVQKMVNADAAGVAFAVDPVNGDEKIAVVAAARGLGESLVSGECQGDTWRVGTRRNIVSRDIESERPVLSDRQVHRVAGLVRKVSKVFGAPQDIEWAIQNNRLYLLQSRDITTVREKSDADGTYALWDNSNIVESYGGVTTPLTFSIARGAYQEAYRHFGRVLGVSERIIAQNNDAYAQMIGLIRGRVYYNLLNWYRLLMLTPGFRFNRKFMEQMMGVTQGLPDDAVPQPEDGRRLARLRAALGMLRVAWRLLNKLVRHNSRVIAFHRKLDIAMQPVALNAMPLDALLAEYKELQSKVIPAWETPLINDLYCMIFHGLLRQLSERWLPCELAEIHNDLVCGEAGIISLEPVARMQSMAALARRDSAFVTALCEQPLSVIEFHLLAHKTFATEYNDYLARFGDRCLDELKLESQTLGDDPLPLLRAIGQLAKSSAPSGSSGLMDNLRRVAEEKISVAFSGKPFRRAIFGVVLKLARARVRDRENLRFERTRVYGRVRAIFVEVGRRFVNLQAIENADDIFYLDVAEITAFASGTGSSAAISALVLTRRDEFQAYADSEEPPRRFITCGPPQLASSMQEVVQGTESASGLSRSGQACSPGVVRGPVKIVRDPRTATVVAGDILVAQRTDPGWVTIFPLVSGMIMERGSLLSHSAIVARELGLPAVVGVEDACQWLADGDWVELNGATGTIRKLEQSDDRAA
jgi:pyruvate,water dikinase